MIHNTVIMSEDFSLFVDSRLILSTHNTFHLNLKVE